VPSDAFGADGLTLSGAPDDGGDANCVNATAVAVRGEANARFLAASLPDKPETCNATPVMLIFNPRVAKVELTYATPGDRVVQVTFADFSRTVVTGSAVSDDGSHGGIANVIIAGKAGPNGAATPPALKTVKYVQLG
jgi:hypothetical protein